MIETSPPNNGRQVLRKTAHGIFWNFVAYGLSKLVVLLTTSILARLLSKDDFGLIALAVVAINYLEVIKDLGLGIALIQRQEDVNEAADTVFTLNLIFGVFLASILIPIAPFVADYFNNPMVIPVLRWLGVSFILSAISSVHVVILKRNLDYRKKLVPDMGSALVKGVVSIWLALAGHGVWALVFGQLSGVLTSVILFWFIVPWRPRLKLDPKVTKSLLSFGSSIIGSDILSVSIDNLGYIIIGRMYGAVQLGVYTLAYRLPEMLLIGNLWIMANVTFPAFANIQKDMDSLRHGFLASVRLVGMIAFPICLGLMIAADPVVRVVFGDQWSDAVPVLRVLALYALVTSIGYHAGDVYKAIGRPDILLKLTILTLILMIPSLLFGAQFGLAGVAWGYVLVMLIERFVGIYISTRFIQVSVLEIFSQLGPALKGSLAMAGIALGAMYLSAGFLPFVQLLVVVLSGVISYGAVLWLAEGENLVRLFDIIRRQGE